MTYEQLYSFAEIANGYKDDFGKWVFRDSEDLADFAKLVEALYKSELASAYSQIQMLRTDLAAAEQVIRELRVIK